MIVSVLHIWFADENAIVREKSDAVIVARRAPLLDRIVRQGIEEGVFTTPYPDQAGIVILAIMRGMTTALLKLLIAFEQERQPHYVDEIITISNATSEAIERVLGAPAPILRSTGRRSVEGVVRGARRRNGDAFPERRSFEMTPEFSVASGGNTLNKLIISAIRNFIISVIVLGALLCLVAGTLNYWQGWVFSVVFGVCNLQQGIYLAVKDPALLERRTKVTAEAQSTGQKVFMFVGLGAMLGMIMVSALDHRFGWSQVSGYVSLIGDVVIGVSYYLYYLVFRENSYAASTIQTFEGQKVISTGLYGLIRHPKYVGDLVLVIGIPLALGS